MRALSSNAFTHQLMFDTLLGFALVLQVKDQQRGGQQAVEEPVYPYSDGARRVILPHRQVVNPDHKVCAKEEDESLHAEADLAPAARQLHAGGPEQEAGKKGGGDAGIKRCQRPGPVKGDEFCRVDKERREDRRRESHEDRQKVLESRGERGRGG